MNSYDHQIWTSGVLSGYNFNYGEGMDDDDKGIDHYASVRGDTVFVASSVISPGLVSECHIFGK